MYFLRGGLPWQGLKAATNKQKYEKIGEKKQTTAIKDLCDGFPEQFNTYLSYVRNLGFEDTPDYDYLRDLFTKALQSTGEVEDGEYDWMKLNNGKGWDVPARPSHRDRNNEVGASAADVKGGVARDHRGSRTPVPQDRLNAELPKPGAVRQSQGGQMRTQPSRRHNDPLANKRSSNGMNLEPNDNTSTAPQFANSTPNLPAAGRNTSQQLGGRQPGVQSPQAQARPQQQQQPQQEQKPGAMQKLLKMLCCG